MASNNSIGTCRFHGNVPSGIIDAISPYSNQRCLNCKSIFVLDLIFALEVFGRFCKVLDGFGCFLEVLEVFEWFVNAFGSEACNSL